MRPSEGELSRGAQRMPRRAARQRIWLVPEVHPLNLPLWNLLSWFRRVHVGRVQAWCLRVLSPRIQVVDVDQHVPADAAHCFQAAALNGWEEIVNRVRARPWLVWYEGRRVDFTVKACQELAKLFEQWQLFKRIQSRSPEYALVDSMSAYLECFLKVMEDVGGDVDKLRSYYLSSQGRALSQQIKDAAKSFAGKDKKHVP